jgi:hypothetical protein
MSSVIPKLGGGQALNLIKLIISRYMMRYNHSISTEVLVKLLFLTLYTDTDKDNTPRLLDAPRARLPVEFRIYLKGPFLPIDELLKKLGAYDEGIIVKAGDKYLVRNSPNKVFENAYNELVKGGLKDLTDYAVRVVDEYGKYREDSLIELSMKILRLSPIIKAMAFNMSLDAYIEARRALRKVFESNEYVDEEELYPDLFRRGD